MSETVEPIEAASELESGVQKPRSAVPLGGALARMRTHEPSFTATDRRIAAELRTNGRELVGLPIDDLAGRIGASTTSIVRFSRRLGYRGLRELMLALAAEVLSEAEPEPPQISPEDDLEAIVRKVTSAAKQALDGSTDVLDRASLDRAITALARAGRVQLFGVGGSSAIAQDAHYRFARLGIPVAVLTDSQLQPVVAAMLKPDDVAFVISHTGRSVEPVHVLDEAKRAGATTILLTSFANTPAAKRADIVLLTAPVSTAPWDGMAPLRVAQLTVIDMICVAIAGRSDERGSDFRARYDAMLNRHMLPGSGSGTSQREQKRNGALDGVVLPQPQPKAIAPAPNPRFLSIDGVENVRHLGDFRLPSGKQTVPVLLRSAMLHDITATGFQQLRDLGVTTVVDLRLDWDHENWPAPSFEGTGIQLIRAEMHSLVPDLAPDLDGRLEWIAVYKGWMDGGQNAIRTVLEAVAETDGTVLMHCALGEDRSGIAAAIILDFLGVKKEEIVADYASSPNAAGWEFLISAALDYLHERWGSGAAYFIDAGIAKNVLTRARARLEGRRVV